MQSHSILSSLVNTRNSLSLSTIVQMLSQRIVFCLGFYNLSGFVAIGPVSDLLDAYNLVDYGYGGISGG